MIRFAPLRSFRDKVRAHEGFREEPMATRLQSEALRLRVLLKVESNFGFDPDQEQWWFQTQMPVEDRKPLDLLFLLDTDFPVSAPQSLFVPRGEDLGLPVLAQAAKGPDGWQLALCPVRAWRPGDDLIRTIEWLSSWVSLRQADQPHPPVPLEYET